MKIRAGADFDSGEFKEKADSLIFIGNLSQSKRVNYNTCLRMLAFINKTASIAYNIRRKISLKPGLRKFERRSYL
jgi:hypothetical protein